MKCEVGENRYWRHQWSTWDLVTYTGSSYQLNQRNCTRCYLTQTRAT